MSGTFFRRNKFFLSILLFFFKQKNNICSHYCLCVVSIKINPMHVIENRRFFLHLMFLFARKVVLPKKTIPKNLFQKLFTGYFLSCFSQAKLVYFNNRERWSKTKFSASEVIFPCKVFFAYKVTSFLSEEVFLCSVCTLETNETSLVLALN